jgi:hypothetical protein
MATLESKLSRERQSKLSRERLTQSKLQLVSARQQLEKEKSKKLKKLTVL